MDWLYTLGLLFYNLFWILIGRVLFYKGFSTFYIRKLVHIMIGIAAATSMLFISTSWLLVLSLTFIIGNSIAHFYGLYLGVDSKDSPNKGIIYFVVSFFLLVVYLHFISSNQQLLCCLAFLVLTFADPLAAAIGTRIPSRIWIWDKTINGSLAMFFSTTIVLTAGFSFGEIDLNREIWAMIFLIALIATLVEGVSRYGLDNLFIPLSVLITSKILLEEPHLLTTAIYGAVILAVFTLLCRKTKSLSPDGAVATWLMGFFLILAGSHWVIPVVVFFILSSVLSKIQSPKKQKIAQDFSKGHERDVGQVLANGGVAWACCFANFLYPNSSILYMGYLASIATATADTWATEIGTLYPGRTFHILTWKNCSPGVSGGISVVGTLAGCLGGWIIGMSAWLSGAPLPWTSLLWITTIAAFLGSLVDSILGATCQGLYWDEFRQKWTENPGENNTLTKGWAWFNNDVVNCLATLAGAAFGSLFIFLSTL